MAQLDTTRNYNDGEVLVEADLDAFLDDIESFINVTKLNDDNIQNNGITGSSKLLNQSVTESKLAANSVTTLKIADSNVTTAKIANDAVTTAKIPDDAITTAKILDDAVTIDKMAVDSVDTEQLVEASVTADILKDSADTDADRAVTTDHIRDAAITTAKINDGAITPAKHSTNYVRSTLSNGSVGNGTTNIQATSLTVAGRPVLLVLSGGTITNNFTNDGNYTVSVSRFDGASTHTAIISNFLSFTGNSPGGVVWDFNTKPLVFVDAPSAGTYTYELRIVASSFTVNTLIFSGTTLTAYEL